CEEVMRYVIGNNENDSNAYITHGVAKDKWKKFRRRNRLKDFVTLIYRENERFGDITCRAIINLSSEMAKQCTQK
ncbi:MAG: hypothetical protein ACI4BH_05920, partial [Muribaculaceae bacterium]